MPIFGKYKMFVIDNIKEKEEYSFLESGKTQRAFGGELLYEVEKIFC